ncbi:MAG TPA: orotidine-5'-phosphate decarboxylase, partial [Acidimicrobiia bacterium]|nr:orotidine-5'-phosphate decarboxylase [Acidimicrobiia bacterium]
AIARPLADEVGGFKLGLEIMSAAGPAAVETVAELGKPVFCDMKLHDIPNTVAGAARRIAAAGARWVTVHASGGRQMMDAAVSGMGGAGVLAVTVLTSLNDFDLESIGIPDGVDTEVFTLANLAQNAGVEGLVCAPGDVAALRHKGIELTIFTPSIRLTPARDDQKRTGTPEEAVAAGADYLVVGRPVTRAPDPVAAAREITESIDRNR